MIDGIGMEKLKYVCSVQIFKVCKSFLQKKKERPGHFYFKKNMVHQYFSKRERQHISDLQKQHSGVKNSKDNMKSVELPLSVAFNVPMPQSQSRLLLLL